MRQTDSMIPWKKPAIDRRLMIILGVMVTIFGVVGIMSLVMPDAPEPAPAEPTAALSAPAPQQAPPATP